MWTKAQLQLLQNAAIRAQARQRDRREGKFTITKPAHLCPLPDYPVPILSSFWADHERVAEWRSHLNEEGRCDGCGRRYRFSDAGWVELDGEP